MTKQFAEIVGEPLQSDGVKNCFGILGDTLNSFAVALSKREIQWVHMRHQEAGAVAA